MCIRDRRGRKLGCGYDGPVRGTSTLRRYPLWSENDRGSTASRRETRFPRCCANYAHLDSCFAYKWDEKYCALGTRKPYCPYTQCSMFKKATDCVNFASGTARQRVSGMGILLDSFRQDCQRGTGSCRGAVQDWAPRDQCVWCPEPGAMDGGGAGECRPGSSLAVCKNAPAQLRRVWANIVRTHDECQPFLETVCRMTQAYPDLTADLVDPVGNFTPTPTTVPKPKPFCVASGLSTDAPSASPVTRTSEDTVTPTSRTSPPITDAGGGTNAPTAPCYSYQNLPTVCNAQSGCRYDFTRRACVKKAAGGR